MFAFVYFETRLSLNAIINEFVVNLLKQLSCNYFERNETDKILIGQRSGFVFIQFSVYTITNVKLN